MDHRDAEMAEVIVILRGEYAGNNEPALKQLRDGGLGITHVDNDDGVVEGSTPAAKVAELRKLPCVETIRITQTWIAEEPSGSAHDKESDDDVDDQPEDWK